MVMRIVESGSIADEILRATEGIKISGLKARLIIKILISGLLPPGQDRE